MRYLLFIFSLVTITSNTCVDESKNENKSISLPIIKSIIMDSGQVIIGAEQTLLYFPLVKGKNIALTVNHTSLIRHTHLIDTLLSSGFIVKRIFTPEHGLRGDTEGGKDISDTLDSVTGLPVISLYGVNKKPTPEQLNDIDIMVFDIQDVGARFYTYVTTLHYIMEACAENSKTMLVLDRPNPNAHFIDGPVLDIKYRSFVGMHPIPVVYGLTIGELARMINGEGWLHESVKTDIIVITLKNYTHKTKYKLPIKPSPNLPNELSISLYPSLCLFEGTDVSIGRGTDKPFQLIGHPDFKKGKYKFTPAPIKGISENPLHNGKVCFGYDLSNDALYKMDQIDWSFLIEFYQNIKDKKHFFNRFFTNLTGNKNIEKIIKKNLEPVKTQQLIMESYREDLEKYKEVRRKYVMYKDE